MHILIIEDEPITARELKFILRKIEPTAVILDTLDSVDASIDFLKVTQPDLIFSDIHLADGVCFDIFNKVDVKCPIVFCTAFDEYAIEAFKTNGIAYILKPFDEETVTAALNKVKKLFPISDTPPSVYSPLDLAALSKLINNQKEYKSSFLVSRGGKLIPVDISNVAFFYIKKEITMLYTVNGEIYMTDYSLDKLETEVDPDDFYRANRQFLISRHTIKEVEKYFARKLVVKTQAVVPEPIIVSKAKATEFTNWLDSKR
jgi:two-component system, LytTR family, response regulator LytT